MVIFDKLSGETHFVFPPASVVLALLKESPKERGMLCNDIAPYVEGSEQEIEDFIDRTLNQFRTIGLIPPAAL
ncbi:HPr-rel-A system PqqD family peptide chaperone [Dechloromonas sp. A34]|uniref:HPr-rel-A system PqqD family peptide chaperone n=1 Tax=Dechloromonas sp. A34 TaxID=447588 RepID=UPI002248B4C5|nr:HPr-rel-A system PqqD family peptide chaperone [Dechloromonas sp. A34]